MPIFRQTPETVRPLARSRSTSRSRRVTSSRVRRFFISPSLAQSTEGLPFQVDQFLGGRPDRPRRGLVRRSCPERTPLGIAPHARLLQLAGGALAVLLSAADGLRR